MRTTIELPDELFRQVKAKAAHEGKKLKELITEYVELGLQQESTIVSQDRQRSGLPVILKATGKTLPRFSNKDLE